MTTADTTASATRDLAAYGPGLGSAPRYAFFCPMPYAMNPHIEAARTHTLDFYRRLGVLTDKGAEAASGYRIEVWSACVHPDCDEDSLKLMHDWDMWGTLTDDYMEARDVSLVKPMIEGCLAILAPDTAEGARPGAHPLEIALADIWRTTRERGMSPRWNQRLADRLSRWIETYLRDADIRAKDRLPSLERYIDNRLWSGASPAYIHLTTLAYDCEMSEALLASPTVNAMLHSCSTFAHLANDVYGLERDASWGDDINAVPIIERDFGCTREEAIRRTIELADNYMRHYLSLEKSLPSVLPQASTEDREKLDTFVTCFRHYMRGALDFYEGTGRYDERPEAGDYHKVGWLAAD
ncbi:hypothetical protein ACIQU4_39420 [Streptomyces sp. NPDC090741]|uniref:terpene synthase family protein n=1 Tax=Streptomyces sp. NPDC090741 TaxID=3365967 RepID=UPI0038209EAC